MSKKENLTLANRIGLLLAQLTMWSVYLIAFMVIIGDYIQIDLFTNGIYKGVEIFMPYQLYDFIGHGQPIKDINIIDNIYLCIDCN